MKKIILLIFTLLLCGCTFNKKIEEKENNSLELNINTEEENIEEEDKYVDDNPIKLGIFLADNNYSNKHVIEDTYYADFNNMKDIASFEVYFTDEKEVSGSSFKDIFNRYYNEYNNIENYRIGYNIKFILSDGTDYNGNFIDNPDILKFGYFFQVYLYDDIHQKDNTFYSHLEKIDDNTLITSIKLFGVNLDSVENIVLTAFTYNDSDDFDSEGNYRGNSRYTIRIKKK